MPFGHPDFFKVEPPKPVNPWANSSAWVTHEVKALPDGWKDDEALKRQFGIELVDKSPFAAACVLFKDTVQALWASHNWLADPIVIAAKADGEAKQVANLLDKNALALKLLKFAEEKDPTQRFYVVEAKDRLAAYKLYAEVQGFIGKVDIDASTKTFNNTTMKIVFVKPEDKQDNKIIDLPSVEEPEKPRLPPNIKLVGSNRG